MFMIDETVKVIVLKYCQIASGVAYSKHIVHLYAYHGGDDLQDKLEVCHHSDSCYTNIIFDED